MSSLVELALTKVIEDHDPHTVILYGSRARGDFSAQSDIDVACFSDCENEIKVAQLFHGVYLDLWVYPTSRMNELTPADLRFCDGVLLRDVSLLGYAYLEKVRDYASKGPEKMSPADVEHTKAWLLKMLSRLDNADIESHYRRVWLQFELLEIYFTLRGKWFLGSKKSFHFLKHSDVKAYALFEKVYSDPQNIAALSDLAAHVMNDLT